MLEHARCQMQSRITRSLNPNPFFLSMHACFRKYLLMIHAMHSSAACVVAAIARRMCAILHARFAGKLTGVVNLIVSCLLVVGYEKARFKLFTPEEIVLHVKPH